MNIGVNCEDPALASMLSQKEGVTEVFCSSYPAGLPEEKRWIQTLPHLLRSAADQRRVPADGTGFPSLDPRARGVLVRGIDSLAYVCSCGFSGEIISDASLYTMNAASVEFLLRQGVSRMTAPFEIDRYSLKDRGYADKTVLVVYARIPLMVSAQCVFLNTGKACPAGEEGPRLMFLTDRKGMSFPVRRVCEYCYNIIYNSVPLSLHKDRDRISDFSPASVRLDFSVETKEEAGRITDFFIRLFNGSAGEAPFSSYTRGHFGKGIL